MTHRTKRLCWAVCSLAGVLAGGGCGQPAEEGATPLAQGSAELIRDPHPTRVNQVLGSAGRPADPAATYDDRRDLFEDENPVLGEDPAKYTSSPQKRYGFQWMRSYARNATVGFFQASDLLPVGDGSVKLRLLRESTEVAHVADMQADARGFALCPEKKFADQINNGAASLSECAGTLIDKNLILTAGHCIRTELTFELKHNMDDMRLVFGYGLTEPGQIVSAGEGVNDPRELHFDPDRDVFRVKEVLSVFSNTADFSILQLVDAAGDPIEALDPRYQPVPLWLTKDDGSDTPPMAQDQYRAGAAIGTGVRLPQKISLSRSRGWGSDPEFVGINMGLDIFAGNSGGGVYDVETGALIGIAHAEFGNDLNVKCPSPPATVNPWPYCPTESACVSNVDCLGHTLCSPMTHRCVVDTEVELDPMQLAKVMDFTRSGNTLVPRGCSQWAPQSWGVSEKLAFQDWVRNNFSVVEANLKDIGDQPDALALSLKAVRMIACPFAKGTSSLDTAITAGANAVLAKGKASGQSTNCAGLNKPDTHCPSKSVSIEPPVSPVKLFDTGFTDEEDVRDILKNSILCGGVQPEPTHVLYSELPEVRLENGRETTFHGTTKNADNYFDVETDTTDVPDALYRIQVDHYTLLYADTFSGGRELGSKNPGTNYDTVLYLMEAVDDTLADPLLLPSSWEENGSAFDDSLCANADPQVNFQLQSQLTAILVPGKKYILGVTGYGDLSGTFNLHVQSTPAPRNGVLIKPSEAFDSFKVGKKDFLVFSAKPFEPLASEGACPEDVDSTEPFNQACVYSTQPALVCQRGDSGDFGFVLVSCPEYASGSFKFHVDATSSPFGMRADDPVAQLWDGQLKHGPDGYLCNDDTQEHIKIGAPLLDIDIPFPSLSASIGSSDLVAKDSVQTFIASGAGVRTFYAHQFDSGMDWQNLGFSLQVESSATNDIWSR